MIIYSEIQLVIGMHQSNSNNALRVDVNSQKVIYKQIYVKMGSQFA